MYKTKRKTIIFCTNKHSYTANFFIMLTKTRASPTSLLQNRVDYAVVKKQKTHYYIYVCSQQHNPLHFTVNFAVELEML